jgi:transposase
MPWKESSVMDERLRIVARLLEGEQMSPLCREFGISRKTGYKIFERYKDNGLEALTDRSRRLDWGEQNQQVILASLSDLGAKGASALKKRRHPSTFGRRGRHPMCCGLRFSA